MPFSGKTFWMPRDAGCLTDGEIGYDSSSRVEAKRGHQWFMDATAPELFSNKKQAIEAVNSTPVLGSSHLNVPSWHNTTSFQPASGQFSDRLFGSESARTVNVVDRNVPPVGSGNSNMEREDFNDPYGGNATMALSMSHSVEDNSRSVNFGGIRKVKVNQVRDSSTDMSASSGHSYTRGDHNAISIGTICNKNDSNNIFLGQTNENRDLNAISTGPNFSKADGNFISMGHTFSKGDGNFMLMGHCYNKGNETILAMGQPFDRGDADFISMGPSYDKRDSNEISMNSSYNKGHEDFISMGPTYDKASENFIMAPSYSKGDENTISVGPIYNKMDTNIASVAAAQDNGDPCPLSMGHNFKGDTNNICFGGFHDEPEADLSGSIISGYDMLISNQNSTQASEVPSQKDLAAHSTADPALNNAQKAISKPDSTPKNKEPKASKKVPVNNFPSNVKSLLTTGMLDGVPVKYVSWSREKNLQGTIKGTGYLCGCKECNFSKALNAYEFERHASCKTKHPNNHIYFENGKTIYAVVQELKNTPQDKLFDAIQNVTGSQINQKNFHIWKASYQAATRELQRIYGKDEVAIAS